MTLKICNLTYTICPWRSLCKVKLKLLWNKRKISQILFYKTVKGASQNADTRNKDPHIFLECSASHEF